MAEHPFPPVRGDDAERNAGVDLQQVDVGTIHRAGVKRCDLIVVKIGGDEGLRGVFTIDYFDAIGRYASIVHPCQILLRIRADRRHWHACVT
jgi:hypothetical protein